MTQKQTSKSAPSAGAFRLLAGAGLVLASCGTTGSIHGGSPSAWSQGAAPTGFMVAEAPSQGASPADLGGTWTFGRCTERLLEVSPAMSLAAAAVEEARAALRLAGSASAPQLDFGLIGTNTDNPALAFMGELNAHELSLAGGLDDTDPTTHVSAGLHASLLLWDGGRQAAVEGAAEAGVAAASWSSEARALALVTHFSELWWSLVEAEQLVEGLEALGPSLVAAEEAAKNRLLAGTGLRSDLLSIQAREFGRQQSLLQARASEAAVRRSIDALLDIPAGTDHDFLADDFVPGLAVGEPPTRRLAEFLAEAREQRPDLRALALLVEAAESELEAAERSSGPTVTAFADTWRDGGTPAWELDRGSYNLGAALNWNLADGGTREAREGQARARLRAGRARLAAAIDVVELELIAAATALEHALARTLTAKARHEAAAAALEELAAGYEGGSVTLERWLGAEAELHAAQTDRSLAGVAMWRSEYRLFLAIGSRFDQLDAGPRETSEHPDSNPGTLPR